MQQTKELVKEYLDKIEQELENLYFPNNNVFLRLHDFITESSKRVRSLFTLLYLKANNATVTQEIIDIIIVSELIHNASLLHDDVIDNADYRRKRTTIAKDFSEKISILTGDYLLCNAIDKLLPYKNSQIIHIFQSTIKKMCHAEVEQFLARGNVPSLEEYINICEGKTASLFVATLKSCALVANMDLISAENFAKNFGIVFQIKNDQEHLSAEQDAKNRIFTANKILGVEKTSILIDNYLDSIRSELEKIPENTYKNGLIALLEEFYG